MFHCTDGPIYLPVEEIFKLFLSLQAPVMELLCLGFTRFHCEHKFSFSWVNTLERDAGSDETKLFSQEAIQTPHQCILVSAAPYP